MEAAGCENLPWLFERPLRIYEVLPLGEVHAIRLMLYYRTKKWPLPNGKHSRISAVQKRTIKTDVNYIKCNKNIRITASQNVTMKNAVAFLFWKFIREKTSYGKRGLQLRIIVRQFDIHLHHGCLTSLEFSGCRLLHMEGTACLWYSNNKKIFTFNRTEMRPFYQLIYTEIRIMVAKLWLAGNKTICSLLAPMRFSGVFLLSWVFLFLPGYCQRMES